MIPPASPVPALARWLAHGLTSRTHPVLAWTLEHFLHPLGIEADWLEAEPFSALECGEGECWLRAPRWNPARFDPSHPARGDFGIVLAHPSSMAVRVDSRGNLSFVPVAGLAEAGRSPLRAGADPCAARAGPQATPTIAIPTEAGEFLASWEKVWNAARHGVRAMAEADAFILACAGLLLARDPASALYVAGDDRGYCEAVRSRLAASQGA